MEDLEPFALLKSNGVDANGAYLKAKQLGWTTVERIRMLRLVYGLSLLDAKAVMVAIEQNGMSLSDYQESLLPEIKAALKGLDDPSSI
jgi:hypothetical protein